MNRLSLPRKVRLENSANLLSIQVSSCDFYRHLKKEKNKAHMSHWATNYNFLKQRPNESQKAVMIYVMEFEGEIASKIWPFV